jgi:glycerol-3-phosphate dehydrogenase (NAD(P)+)
MSSVAIVGAGAWGCALAIHAARAGHDVTLWARDPGGVGRAPPRLPGFALPDAVRVTASLPREADAILLAVPTQHLRPVLAQMRPQAPLLLCCKGIEATTLRLPLEIAAALHPGVPASILSGPNFAAGIAAGLPAAAIIAGPDASARGAMLALLGTAAFRLYGNDDAIGAQLGGAAKNVIAIAAGAITGAGYGENARAALITRGLAELSRLIVAQGGRAETAAGLSGLGDLVLTCTGNGSRNFAHGLALAKGDASPPAGGPVVEGVATAPSLVARASGVDLPICHAVADLLAGSLTLDGAISRVLARKPRNEF